MVEQLSQPGLGKLLRQRPTQAFELSLGQQLLNRPHTDADAVVDLSNAQTCLYPQAQDFSNFTHCRSLGWHHSVPGKGNRATTLEQQRWRKTMH